VRLVGRPLPDLLTGSWLREDKTQRKYCAGHAFAALVCSLERPGQGHVFQWQPPFSRRGGPAEPASAALKVGDRLFARLRGGTVVAVDIESAA
jgi:hypothetical protein